MKLFRKRDFITVGFILAFSAAAITLFYTILKPVETLPIYQPAEVNEKLVDSSVIHVSKYHKISDFELTNQNGQKITQEFYNDKIYVADFFFTTCQDICPIMTKNMYRLQEELKNDNDILELDEKGIEKLPTKNTGKLPLAERVAEGQRLVNRLFSQKEELIKITESLKAS